MAINTEPTDEGYTILQGVNKIIELMENGGGGLLVTIDATGEVPTMDKSYRDISMAISSGIPVTIVAHLDENTNKVFQVISYGFVDDYWIVELHDASTWGATTQDDNLEYINFS